jgi:hypothetical protein
VQADSDLLSDTLNTTLIPWLCEFNGWPALTLHRQIKAAEDLQAASETDKNVSEMGFRPPWSAWWSAMAAAGRLIRRGLSHAAAVGRRHSPRESCA